MTLIDVADTLAVMGDKEGFDQAVRRIIDDVQFDQDAKVQVFEVVRLSPPFEPPGRPCTDGYERLSYRPSECSGDFSLLIS